MLSFNLTISEKYIFSTINTMYIDEFLSRLIVFLVEYQNKTVAEIVDKLGNSNFLKLHSILNYDNQTITDMIVEDNVRILKYFPANKQLFFNDGKYELFYDFKLKFLSVGVINDTIRRIKTYKNVDNLSTLLGVVRDFMSKICKPSTKKAIEPNKMAEAIINVKKHSIKEEVITTTSELKNNNPIQGLFDTLTKETTDE